MRTKLLTTLATTALLLGGGALLGPGTGSAAPGTGTPAAAARAGTTGVSAYLCAIRYDGSVATGGSSVDGNPFDPSIPQGQSCVGHITEVSAVSFDTEQTLNIGSQSTGAGAGKITFNPLAFSLPVSAFTDELFSMEASGTPFKNVLIAFRRGNTKTAFYTVRLGLAAVKTTGISYAARTLGDMKVTMEYGGLQMFVRTQSANGGVGAPSVSGWNRVRNVADVDPSSVIQ